MDINEYKKFIMEKGYKEEREAINIVNVILQYHNQKGYDFSLYPRFIANIDGEKLEYDLLIILKGERKFERKIGIEFKQNDIKKVISQAVARRKYVDYQYIATKNIWLNYDDIAVMCYFGLGWIIYMDNFAKIIFPSRFYDTGITTRSILNFIIHEKLRKEADKVVKEAVDKIKERVSKLDKWIGE